MKRSVICFIMIAVLALVDFTDASAQLYRRENRRAGRAFEKGAYEEALLHYEKALQSKGVDSLALMYNKAYVLHSDRRDSTQNARLDTLALQALDSIADVVSGTEYEYDYHYTRGVIDIDMENWQGAVDQFKKCILLDPEDMTARENYVYAKKHLQQQQQQNNQYLNQDQNQDGQQDQNQDKNKDGQQGQDQNQDQDQDGQHDQNQDKNKDDQQGQGQPQKSKISQQAAQQILQAMQAKERETQDKVEKKKAAAMKSKQKEKNW